MEFLYAVRDGSGLLAGIPVPAYTNDRRIVLAPEPEMWRGIYLKQVCGCAGGRADAVRRAYGQCGGNGQCSKE